MNNFRQRIVASTDPLTSARTALEEVKETIDRLYEIERAAKREFARCDALIDAKIAIARLAEELGALCATEEKAFARLAPASAPAPESLTHAPTTEKGSDVDE